MQIKAAQQEVEIAKANTTDGKADHNGEGSYYATADKLANLLIQYKFYQEGYVGEIKYSEWDSNSWATNHVKVTYTNTTTGEEEIAYFDYVTADANDNWLSQSNGDNDNVNLIDHIIVVKKTPEFVYQKNFLSKNTLTITETQDGQLIYKINGSTVDSSSVTRKVDSNGDEYYMYKNKKYTLTGFTGANDGKGINFFSELDFKKGSDAYSKKRADLTEAEMKYSSAISELASMSESTVVASVSNSNSVASSMANSASISNSASESASDSTYASTVNSEKNSEASSESTSTSASAYASLYASLSNSLSGSQSESTSVVESQSTSTSVVESQSTSTSVAESQSTSTSVAESQSTSTSVAESQSTSTSVAESQSTSTSVAESQSTSTSVAESQSTSTSVAESQSTSTSAAESQ
ncbi:MAG: hypothetical protein IJV71_08135, partial [Lachnospiraceae bacterium]|nr:hypothetical protein [Lachnospiraceae bacterium]